MSNRAASRPPVTPDPHAGHHRHIRGNGIICSCGEFFGCFTVALPDWTAEQWALYEATLSCDLCGMAGVTAA